MSTGTVGLRRVLSSRRSRSYVEGGRGDRDNAGGFTGRMARVVDSLAEVISPGWAVRRIAGRAMLAVAKGIPGSGGGGGGFSGGKTTDRNPGRSYLGRSPDADILPDLVKLRAKSRHLYMNEPYATGILDGINFNVVGTGLRPKSRLNKRFLKSQGVAEKTIDEWQMASDRNWRVWARHSDSTRRLNFYEQEAQAFHQVMLNGDCFALLPMRDDPDRKVHRTVELIEADRVMTPFGVQMEPERRRRIRDGVELDSDGVPIAYWVLDEHPGGPLARGKRTFTEIRARDDQGRPRMIHLFFQIRPGQTRGYPVFSPVMDFFSDLKDYLEAEIVRAKVHACFAAFITKNGDALKSAQQASRGQRNADGSRPRKLSPGTISQLEPGESIEFSNANVPGGMFQPFTELLLRSIASALNLSFEQVAKTWGKATYSSARAAIIDIWKMYMVRQEWLINHFAQPVWDLVQEECFLRGLLPPVDYFAMPEEWNRAKWIGAKRLGIDPEKDARAAKVQLENRTTTRAAIAAAHGEDIDEVFEELADEESRLEELGLSATVEAPVVPGGDTDNETIDQDKKDREEAEAVAA